MELSNKSLNLIRKDARDALAQLNKGKSAVSIASELYVRALPDKAPELGDVMAARIDAIVSEYENLKKDALEHPEEWVERLVDAQCEGLDCVGRCRLLYELLCCVMAVNTGEKIGGEFDESSADEELEKELREKLRQALECSTLGAGELETLAQLLESTQARGISQQIVNYGRDQHDVRVILSMIAYVSAQTGALEEAGADITLEEITLGLCAAQDAQELAQQVEDGEITEEQAARVLGMMSRILTLFTGKTLEGVATIALGGIIPGMPWLLRKAISLLVGETLISMSEETTEHFMQAALERGWRSVQNSDSRLACRLRAWCREADEDVVPYAERTMEIVRHPIRALVDHITRTEQQEQTQTALA